jgi:UDP-3-O-acyl-N-acetylglucosamine deacetylase
MQEQDNNREKGRLEGEFVKDKMLIVIVLVGNLSLRGRKIRDLVFRVQRKRAFIYGCTM